MSSPSRPPRAVILAAGRGTRMRSAVPKVLHHAAGRPLLAWVVEAARGAGCEEISVVVGHGGERVRQAFAGEPGLAWVEQPEQRGTGDALARCAGRIEGEGPLLVLSGDVPLVTPASLGRLLEAARGAWGAMAVAELAEPGALGRVTARPDGTLERIVEAADAGPAELAIRTVNAGLYALPAPDVFARLERLAPDNEQGELYLTDAVVAAAAERPVRLVELDDPDEALGVNTRADLARVHQALLRRKAEALMESGVTLLDPASTVIEPQVEIAPDAVVHPGVTLLGATSVGGGAVLHRGAWARDTVLAEEVVVEPYSVLDGARIGAGCKVGPFARLRPGAVLEAGAKVGNFVEVKQSHLGRGVKAGHLAYLGDAEVGEGANIGAGTITCNYDGVAKHPTEIGRGAFIGSDTMLVAPVKVGEEAVTGAGSVISDDVPDGALAVERSRQRTIPGWGARRGRRKKR